MVWIWGKNSIYELESRAENQELRQISATQPSSAGKALKMPSKVSPSGGDLEGAVLQNIPGLAIQRFANGFEGFEADGFGFTRF